MGSNHKIPVFTAENQAGVLLAELLVHIQVYVLQWCPHCASTAKLKKLKYHISPTWPQTQALGGSHRKQAGWVKACLDDLVFMHVSVQLKILKFSQKLGSHHCPSLVPAATIILVSISFWVDNLLGFWCQ